MSTTERPVAIITGTSRDLGEYTSYALAQRGWDILGLYKNPKHKNDQERVIAGVRNHRVKMVAVCADLVNPETPQILKQTLEKEFKRKANALILNAAGGYDQSLEVAREINVYTQLRLIDELEPSLNDNSPIVYINSDGGHRYNEIKASGKFAAYGPVGQAKFEAEIKIREKALTLSRLRVIIAVGNALDGSFVNRVLRRQFSDSVDEWVADTPEGRLPTVMEMAILIERAVTLPYPSGSTLYLGISPKNQLYPPPTLLR